MSLQSQNQPVPFQEALAYQSAALQGVSRTFALTIPQLPESVRIVVGNAYLLCRIADTIEDCVSLNPDEKRRFAERFVDVVAERESPERFAAELAPRLIEGVLDAERDLVAHTPAVVGLTHAFAPEDRAAIARCVRVMAEGMARFQEGAFAHGLDDQQHLDDYCYYVAGVVGEMLTDLFCHHSPSIAKKRAALKALAVSFGQGLQMTNILKDVWDDKRRNVCWLPASIFRREGFDLSRLTPEQRDEAFEKGLGHVIATAHGHLRNALDYTLLIPRSEQGIRQFCLWALGMAVLTLRQIDRKRDFVSGADVKISRRTVKAVVLASRLCGRSNWALRRLFAWAAAGLPRST